MVGNIDIKLPEGWCLQTIGDVVTDLEQGWSPKCEVEPSTSEDIWGVIKTTAIQPMRFLEHENKRLPNALEPRPELELLAGDLLITRAGPRVRAAVTCFVPKTRRRLIVCDKAYRFRVDVTLIMPPFLSFALNEPVMVERLDSLKTGISDSGVNLTQEKFLALEITVPPLAEQKRIVAMVEELLARVNAARARLAKAPALLKRFRQSVLAAACSGQLTAEWREAHDDTAPQPTGTESTTGDLPAAWVQTTVGEVIEGLKYGTSKKCDYACKGSPVLRIPNIGDGVITRDDLKYAELEDAELGQLRLRPGDVLMIRSNGSVALLGKAAIVSEAEMGFAYAGYLIRLRPDQAKIMPAFLNAVLSSFGVRLQIELPARSTSGVNNINSDEVRALSIPLPPLPEQHEIVRRVEALFALADKIEARVQAATARVEKITQSILAKAFRGELVPTEAELARQENRPYEPAKILLDRIRAARAGNVAPAKSNRPRQTRQRVGKAR